MKCIICLNKYLFFRSHNEGPHNTILKRNLAGKSPEGEAEMRGGYKTVENSAFLP
jgi:hypothetical protein